MSVTQLRREHRREPALTRRVTYAVSEPLDPAPLRCATDAAARPTLARLRIVGGDRPGLHEAIVVAEVARRALQSVYGRANQNATSTVFSRRDGERMRTDQHAHAHYLVTSDPGSARVDHLTVWAPEGFGPNEVAALAQVTELRDTRAWPEPLRIALTALGTPDSLPLSDLCAHTNRWRTLTPIVLTRHAKRRGGQTVDGPAEQIARELQLRGLPPATRITRIEGAWHEFRARRPTGRRPVPAALLGTRIELAAPARGPIALGALRPLRAGTASPRRVTSRPWNPMFQICCRLGSSTSTSTARGLRTWNGSRAAFWKAPIPCRAAGCTAGSSASEEPLPNPRPRLARRPPVRR